MVAAKHTPGPWYTDGYRIYAPTDEADKRSGAVLVDGKEFDATDGDLNLIAAAPDLYAALAAMLETDIWADAEGLVSFKNATELNDQEAWKVAQKARAALAKARGEAT